jgi:hypothetical protein
MRVASRTTYIQSELAAIGRPEVAARLVEGWMICENGTLDSLSRGEFRSEVRAAVACVDADPALSERVAQSYGL